MPEITDPQKSQEKCREHKGETTRWEVPAIRQKAAGGEDVALTGFIVTDGSMIQQKPKKARRAGWSVVQVDGEGKVLQAAYGPLECLQPNTYLAELHALTRAFELAVPPILVWSDCKSVVDDYNRGPDRCTHSRKKGAALWRRLFRARAEWGEEDAQLLKDSFQVKWTKGHATLADIEARKSTAWQRTSNDHADHFARKGSSLAAHRQPCTQLIAAHKRAMGWYAWLKMLIGEWPKEKDFKESDEKNDNNDEKAVKTTGGQVHDTMPHEVWRTAAGGVICVACGKKPSAKGKSKKKSEDIFLATPCAALAGEEKLQRREGQARHEGRQGQEKRELREGQASHEEEENEGKLELREGQAHIDEGGSKKEQQDANKQQKGKVREPEGEEALLKAILENKRRRVEREERAKMVETLALAQKLREKQLKQAGARPNLSGSSYAQIAKAKSRGRVRIRGKKPPSTTATGDKAEATALKLLGLGWRQTIHASHDLVANEHRVFCTRCARHAATIERSSMLRLPRKAKMHGWELKQMRALKAGKDPSKVKRPLEDYSDESAKQRRVEGSFSAAGTASSEG